MYTFKSCAGAYLCLFSFVHLCLHVDYGEHDPLKRLIDL